MCLNKRCLSLRSVSLLHIHRGSLLSLPKERGLSPSYGAFSAVLQTLSRTYHLPSIGKWLTQNILYPEREGWQTLFSSCLVISLAASCDVPVSGLWNLSVVLVTDANPAGQSQRRGFAYHAAERPRSGDWSMQRALGSAVFRMVPQILELGAATWSCWFAEQTSIRAAIWDLLSGPVFMEETQRDCLSRLSRQLMSALSSSSEDPSSPSLPCYCIYLSILGFV